jgi:tryptophan synthase alpha chain
VYKRQVFKYGVETFISEAGSAGIDGLIIPDLPIEERKDIIEIGDKYGVYLIPLVAPTSKDRIQKITENGKGFVYCVSTAGVTGVRQSIKTDINEYMNIVSSYTKLPKALGFGISGPEMAQIYKDCCEGIIVGSAIVRTVAEAKNMEAMIEGVRGFVSRIKGVL